MRKVKPFKFEKRSLGMGTVTERDGCGTSTVKLDDGTIYFLRGINSTSADVGTRGEMFYETSPSFGLPFFYPESSGNYKW